MKPIAKLTKRERAAILRNPNAKLSDLLEVATLDALALQKQKRVKFNMAAWVHPNEGEPCTVCLAGASLFRTLDKRIWISSPDSAHVGNAAATNCYRINDARSADPYREHYETRETVRVALMCVRDTYKQSIGRAPFRSYLRAARELRKAGL